VQVAGTLLWRDCAPGWESQLGRQNGRFDFLRAAARNFSQMPSGGGGNGGEDRTSDWLEFIIDKGAICAR
jgi:hypothetical protein